MEWQSATSPTTVALEPRWEDQIPVHSILRPSPVLAPTDSLRKAMDLLQRTPKALVPVVEDGFLVGIVQQENLGNGAVTRAIDARDPHAVRVRDFMASPLARPLPAYLPLADALEFMDRSGQSVLPVADPSGRHVGVVSRSELVSHLTRAVRPERMGGMATPLGVYLTSGIARAGPGDLGLFLAGFTLCLMLLLSLGVVFALAWLVERYTGYGLVRTLLAAGTGAAQSARGPELILFGGYVAAFGLLFRFSPLAGLHAAEHQVVNAVEHGEDLDPDAVRRMSPVHPRCGTNLAVVAVLASFFGILWGVNPSTLPILALLIVLLRVPSGNLAQKYVTTRPPTDREVASGIWAGQELIRRHWEAQARPLTLIRRIWNMGILQSLAGFSVAMSLVQAILRLLGLGWLPIL